MTIITPTTELDAVNEMLASIGEAPVNSLTAGLDEASIAHRILTNVSRQVQARGWFFNREVLRLSPSESGEIRLPHNILKVDDEAGAYIQRGLRVYDRRRNTYQFPQGVYPFLVVVGLPFEDLTETARTYIYLKAARRFHERFLGSATLQQYAQVDELEAYRDLKQEEIEAGNYNLFNNPEVQRALVRSPDVGAGLRDSTYDILRGY